ncbi:ATP synthase subunit A [Haloferax mediterranei ATCC 33500]|uniref:A-type ATP synthase subunit A n=1 Tax=Haloferax mediterranei (strain ATCC 33500 / DSM 1411 / JCM 8866 / NBRC 14739 / NCIMB 2177 / R-4) TaxID=523841 RepID=I3R1D1_HALMT|nr:ATP synthase subunit A [Haloferax mediterranei]AFK18041.1 A-type ATP synthase subunit A [Haloferax mediterranei ATCC 33500]AHZ22545.1 ATP synthase subunit alpha [Haloferax mediterranei ATCC 33500]EMA02683.1 V-type ATP synthase subunit A [Haloferax mediterranei ATCC 33500]MDX5988133.1 ATP synthase subunit A [Haloferax mediterranei ATCC 33500]QCQ74582.1 ATP synthase subunit A [Haloferax mediterranei ATCC 33500]
MSQATQDSVREDGVIASVSGPVVTARGLDARMNDVVYVGDEGLMGEVIEIEGDLTTIQVYEETSGVGPGEPVESTGEPLTVDLGPGMMDAIYDGVQRPLDVLESKMDSAFLDRGVDAPGIDLEKEWEFEPTVSEGDEVAPGDVVGTVPETVTIEHKVMVPPDFEGGEVVAVEAGEFAVTEAVVELDNGEEITMHQEWPVRQARPAAEKKTPREPLVSGQRILDGLFPIAKGGTAAIPGPFGSGKTVTQHQLAKWADADIVVYVGCGERGNEMTEVIEDFPELDDPKTGNPLMARTCLIANTSNMPVAARESCIYTGITIAEYYRDMGYDVALMADSTSRWAEAMREISSRLEEMPGEEGYPAYLAARLSEFYERAGYFTTVNGQEGSVSVIGAVSPPGGDFSEPVTQNTLRIVKTFWALDADLAERRHFPAINWNESYSLYQEQLDPWFVENVEDDWPDERQWAVDVLDEENELQEIVQLVGKDALPEDQQLTLEVARYLREAYLQQNAFHPTDTYCEPEKTYGILTAIHKFNDEAFKALEAGVPVEEIQAIEAVPRLNRIGVQEDWGAYIEDLKAEITEQLRELY